MPRLFPSRAICPLSIPNGEAMAKDAPIALRPAVESDSWIYASFVNTAADGMFATMFGSRWQSVVAELSTQPDHAMSLEHARVLDRNGEVLGMAAAMTGLEARKGFDSLLWPAAGWRAIRAAAMSLALRPMFRFLDVHDDDEFYLLALAVVPEERGQGLGTRLLDDVTARAIEAKSNKLALHVDTNNPDAQRLYSRYGFQQESVSPPALLVGGDQVERWVKPVSGDADVANV